MALMLFARDRSISAAQALCGEGPFRGNAFASVYGLAARLAVRRFEEVIDARYCDLTLNWVMGLSVSTVRVIRTDKCDAQPRHDPGGGGIEGCASRFG
ncbi:hypothetical protein [Stutzerimonas stutzeri]|uniref:hypothetical protein n=1 Tax=Stutzerimonas stutzeri TaxID=316 RepID=UPI001145F91A|nr:hypothetical protein [Stutzerimonas stutzeri]